jgi:tetratricopeptide (TPR) repeat protein
MKLCVNLLLAGLAAFAGMPGRSAPAAADTTGAFDSANKLYEHGQYAEAAGAYEKLAQSGSVSPALCFNLGNARFKSGQIGRAIEAYRQAAELTPRDPDVRANLQFARNQVQGPTLRAGAWERWLGALSLNEWARLAAGAIWLTFLLLAAMQLRPGSSRALRSYAAAFGGAAVVLCACLGLALANHTTAQIATIVAREVTVRAGPLDDSPGAFTAYDGAELRVLDRKDNWLQVTDGTRRPGWLRTNEVVQVN